MKIYPLLSKSTKFIILITVAVLSLTYVEDAIAASEKEVGNIKDMRGSANILREKQKYEAQKNEPVFKADTVRTFEKSRVKILFIDDSLVMVGENTSFLISEHLKDKANISVFNLIDGVMNVIVGKKGFEVHTPTAVSSARGTSFVVWTEKGKTGMAVTEGRVELRNAQAGVGEKILINAGNTSYVEIGKPPVVSVKTHPDLIKRYYEQTLEPDERWGPVILKATGSGVPSPTAVNAAQARLMGLRAAKVDAMRNLIEQAYGVRIMSDSSIQDFVLKNDVIKSRVDAFIKGAWVVEERQLADGAIEVDMEIALGIGFRRMFLEQREKD